MGSTAASAECQLDSNSCGIRSAPAGTGAAGGPFWPKTSAADLQYDMLDGREGPRILKVTVSLLSSRVGLAGEGSEAKLPEIQRLGSRSGGFGKA